jgi:hypothetical protein
MDLTKWLTSAIPAVNISPKNKKQKTDDDVGEDREEPEHSQAEHSQSDTVV